MRRQPCLQQPDSAGGLAQQKPGSGPGPSLVADETKFGPGLPSLPQLPTSSYASGAGAADAARRRGGPMWSEPTMLLISGTTAPLLQARAAPALEAFSLEPAWVPAI